MSGRAEAVAATIERLKARNVEARALHTSHAFHSSMMDPALAPFIEAFANVTLSPPAIPYVSNLTGTWITAEQATSPEYYARHLRQAVRFADGVRLLGADPAMHFLEVGPAQTLSTLARLGLGAEGARRVAASMPRHGDRRSESLALHDATAALWIAGVAIDWEGLHPHGRPRRVPLPTYPFERKRHWVEAVTQQPMAAGGAAGVASAPAPRAIEDWFFAPTWTRSEIPRDLAALQGLWLVLGRADRLTDELLAGLREGGARCVLVEPGAAFKRLGAERFAARPGQSDDLRAVLKSLRASGTPNRLEGVVHLPSTSVDVQEHLIPR